MKGCLFTIMTFFCLAVFGVCILRGINFNVECKGHLKRAADANTIELAKQELDVALSYLEREGMTEGYTSVLYKTPEEDVGFWYQNLKSASIELGEVPEDASILEKSNALMKLRETLLDQGEKSESVTVPTGISRFPHNMLLGSLLFIAIVICLIGYFALEVMFN